jgi:hypothetical protein
MGKSTKKFVPGWKVKERSSTGTKIWSAIRIRINHPYMCDLRLIACFNTWLIHRPSKEWVSSGQCWLLRHGNPCMKHFLNTWMQRYVGRSIGAPRHVSIFSLISLPLLLPFDRTKTVPSGMVSTVLGKLELLEEIIFMKENGLLTCCSYPHIHTHMHRQCPSKLQNK